MDIRRAARTIGAAMLLHNFLVAKRDGEDVSKFKNFSMANVVEDAGLADDDDPPFAMVTDNNAAKQLVELV